MEATVNRIDFDRLVQSLVLIRLGQELGTDSPLARLVWAACEMAQKVSAVFVVDRF